MTFLTQLDVVNDMLAALGESPLNDLNEGHPLAPIGQRMIATANAREQSKSWWFNKELVDLSPDPAGSIYLPNDTIRVDPQEPSLHYVQRGRRLYKPYAPSLEDKFKFTAPVRCWLVRLVPFEDLPATAQIVVSFSAQLDFQKAYDADQAKFQQLVLEYRQALVTLNAEHIRSQDANLLRRKSIYEDQRRTGAMLPNRWPFVY